MERVKAQMEPGMDTYEAARLALSDAEVAEVTGKAWLLTANIRSPDTGWLREEYAEGAAALARRLRGTAPH